MVSSSRAPRPEPPPPPPPLLTPQLRGWRRPGCLDNGGRGGGARRTARGRDQKPRGNAGEREGPRACGATERGWRPRRRLQTLPPEPRRAFGASPAALAPPAGPAPGPSGRGPARPRSPPAGVRRSVGPCVRRARPAGRGSAALPPPSLPGLGSRRCSAIYGRSFNVQKSAYLSQHRR
ncbi:hypothetical protein VULLAG_LOCUS8588 [Vulpes lagopus]